MCVCVCGGGWHRWVLTGVVGCGLMWVSVGVVGWV